MKPTITRITAAKLGACRGFSIAGFLATILLLLAHLANPEISLLYPAFTLFQGFAASTLYHIILDGITQEGEK